MDAERESSCTPPLPAAEPFLPGQLGKHRSPSAAGDGVERRNSSPVKKKATLGSPKVPGQEEPRRKGKADGGDNKSQDERGRKRQRSDDDSTPRRPSSKEPSNERKHDNADVGTAAGGTSLKKNDNLDNGKERHHRSSRHHHRRKTRSRSKESITMGKSSSPARYKKSSDDDEGSRKKKPNREDREKKQRSKSRRSRSAEKLGDDDNDEGGGDGRRWKKRGHYSRSRSHSRSRRESVRRERRSTSPNGRPWWHDSHQGSSFGRDNNFPGRRNFHHFPRGRYQSTRGRGAPYWTKTGPPRNLGGTLSVMRYTKTLPTVSWRDRVHSVERENITEEQSPVQKIRPITPAIAALQEYDGSEAGTTTTTSSDNEQSRSASRERVARSPTDGKSSSQTEEKGSPSSMYEESIIQHIKLEKTDDQEGEHKFGAIKIDCSIVKKEPLTEEDEEAPRETTKAPAPQAPASKQKFSCSFLDDLTSGKLTLLPELPASPAAEQQDSDVENEQQRVGRGGSESPDSDDYAANWETDEPLGTSPPSKLTTHDDGDVSPTLPKDDGATPPPASVVDPDVRTDPAPTEDATNEGTVTAEAGGEEKRAHLKPRSMHEEIIPLDDLLNVQNQLKSFKSKLEEAEKLKRSEGKAATAHTEGLFAEKLADEYKSFMQSLAQPPGGEAGERERQLGVGGVRDRKRSSSSSSSGSSSSSSSSDSSSDSSSSTGSSSSSSSSSSDTDDQSSADEDENSKKAAHELAAVGNDRGQLGTNDIIPPEAAGKSTAPEDPPVGNAKVENPTTPPGLIVPEYLLPKVPASANSAVAATPQTPTKIYSIRDDFRASEGSDSIGTPLVKPLDLDRGTPIKMKLPSKSKVLPVGGASAALLGPEDEETNGLPPSGSGRRGEGQEEKTSKSTRRRSSEEKSSSRHRQKRSRDRHERKSSSSRNRSRDRGTSSGAASSGSPKRKSRDRDKRSSRNKERSSPSRKERSSQRRNGSSRSPARRSTRSSPRSSRSRRSGSKSRSRSHSRYHSVSPSQRRPPSPRGGRSPVDHRRTGRSRRRYSVEREWSMRRSRSPYGSRRPPSPKDAPPMTHGENQIDIITSTGASPNVHSPVTGYKKSLADSTISDAELENQKRKMVAYGGGYYVGMPHEHGLHLDPNAGPAAAGGGEGGEDGSPKRISLDDRINIALGMNGMLDGGKPGGGKHQHHHGHGQHMQHHHHHHPHAPYGEYPPSHDMYQGRGANYPGGYQEQYGSSPYGPSYGGSRSSLPPTTSSSGITPYYPGSGRGPPPSWAPRSHPYQGYPMAFVGAPLPGPPHRSMLPGEMYRMQYAPPPTSGQAGASVPVAATGASSDASTNSKSQVKQVGNVLEIVPSSAPLPASGSSAADPTGTTTGSNASSASSTVAGVANAGGTATAPSDTSPAEGDPAQTGGLGKSASGGGGASSSALVTPKILTAEELQQRHDRRQELKKKIRAEREKKRLEKKQRKERLQAEIKQLLGSKAIVSGGLGGAGDGGDASSGAGTGGSGGVGGSATGGGIGGGSASSDEEFEMIKHADLLASLARSYEKSILKPIKPPNAVGGGNVVRKNHKKVLFADGVAPGVTSQSSSEGEGQEKENPKKRSSTKQRKKLRRQRTLKVPRKKRLIDRLKLPELEEEPEVLDPELENLPPPPPPPGSPPPELQQPRCLNPPVVRMIDFREGFHAIGHPLPVPPVSMVGPPPHLSGANTLVPPGAPPTIPLPVPPVSMSVPPGPVPAPVSGYRGLSGIQQTHHHQHHHQHQHHHHHHQHQLLPSHLATQRPASPHGGGLPGALHHPHPPPHLFHTHPPHMLAPPSSHQGFHQHMHVPPPSSATTNLTSSSGLITISTKKRTHNSTAAASASNGAGVSAIESIVSTAAAAPAPIVASGVSSAPYDGTTSTPGV